MKKAYICGLLASGKGLMKQLLDGHSKICTMPFQGFLFKKLIPYNFKSIAVNSRLTNVYRTKYYEQMPFFNLIDGHCRYKINFDEFIRNIYYSVDLYITARSGYLYAASGKGGEVLVEFLFDYSRFEQNWFDVLFSKPTDVSLERFLDVMYECFVDNWKNKYIDSASGKIIVAPMQNGFETIGWLLKNVPNAKLLLMDRDGVGVSYAYSHRRDVAFKRRDAQGDLYNFSVINACKRYRSIINSDEIRSNPRVLIVDFDKLVVDTRNTMVEVSAFLEIDYEDILSRATLNRVPLDSDGVCFTGKINEDPYALLPPDELDLLKSLYYGRDPRHSKWKQFYLALKAFNQKRSYQSYLWKRRFQRLWEVIVKER